MFNRCKRLHDSIVKMIPKDIKSVYPDMISGLFLFLNET